MYFSFKVTCQSPDIAIEAMTYCSLGAINKAAHREA